MADKYIKLTSGQMAEQEALATSAGAGSAGKIPALGGDGRLSETMMPTGIAADVKTAACSEDLSAGELINLYNDGGTIKARLADASNGYRANGFVKSAFTSGQDALVYLEGVISGLSGLTPGAVQYLSGATAGSPTETAPSTATHIVQEVGVAVSATEISFEPGQPITLA